MNLNLNFNTKQKIFLIRQVLSFKSLYVLCSWIFPLIYLFPNLCMLKNHEWSKICLKIRCTPFIWKLVSGGEFLLKGEGGVFFAYRREAGGGACHVKDVVRRGWAIYLSISLSVYLSLHLSVYLSIVHLFS